MTNGILPCMHGAKKTKLNMPHRLSIGEILDYRPNGRRSQSSVRRAYKEWRQQQGVPYRCDNQDCEFHTGQLIWNGKPIKMNLDHVDGNSKNHRPNNLRWLCPNCDSQLSTRGGGNKGRIQNMSEDAYDVIGRDGTRSVNVMLAGQRITTSTGKVGAEIEVISGKD